MPPPVHCPNLKGVKIMKARISRKFFCLLLAVVMVCTLLPITALAAEPSGSIESAGITHAGGYLKNAVSVGLKNVNFESSVQVKLYSGDTLLTTATLQEVDPGSYGFLTCCIATETADEYWALTPWTPKDDVVPNKVVLFVDDNEMDTMEFTLDAAEWAALPGTVLPPSGSIERVGITHDNDVLKNAVSVDLKNVNFESSVQVKLYSGDTLLTTATLQEVDPGSYGFLTCCIATETADEYWALTPWTPKDDVVPNKVVLFVDDNEMDTMEFTLDAAEWKALPGTVLPYSGSIERAGITHANGVLKNAVSVDLKNVTFKTSVQVKLYSGDTLLTTATLQEVDPGSYGFLTCCIATETADEYWALTPWTPKDDVVPNKVVLFVDDNEMDTMEFTLDAAEWKALPGTVLPYSGSIERAGITHANGVLKNAVSVDLKNVNFESSVQVQLYSGDTLLTTATLQGVTPGSYGFLTCCIATETADEYWALTPWTPKDNIVPNKAVLFVDGHEQDTKPFTLDANEWAALPGTAFPYSGSIGGGYTYYTIKKATPKLNTYDHFAYVQGYPDGTVKPAGNITRAETAAILFRLMDNSSRKTYLSTKSGFRDVTAGSWYNTYVATLNNAGVITDSANGYFRPNEAITRAELAAMLAKFSETTGAANYFNDVSAKYWAANAIAICAKLGWINGYPDGSFRPDRNVTRAELMAMINRATGRAPKSADAFLPGMKTWSDNTADKWYYLDVQEATNSHSYAVSPTELWTALTAAPDWSRYE